MVEQKRTNLKADTFTEASWQTNKRVLSAVYVPRKLLAFAPSSGSDLIVLASIKRNTQRRQSSEKNWYTKNKKSPLPQRKVHLLAYIIRSGGILRDYKLPEFW